jgi:hypothetical protein
MWIQTTVILSIVSDFTTCMSINHKQLLFKLVLKNWYFVPIPVFNTKKKKRLGSQYSGSQDHSVVSPICTSLCKAL